MNRVDSVLIAIRKSEGRSKGSCFVFDAFFPSRDGVDKAAKVGPLLFNLEVQKTWKGIEDNTAKSSRKMQSSTV